MQKGEIPFGNLPFLVRRPQPATLFDALQFRTPAFGARWFGDVAAGLPVFLLGRLAGGDTRAG